MKLATTDGFGHEAAAVVAKAHAFGAPSEANQWRAWAIAVARNAVKQLA